MIIEVSQIEKRIEGLESWKDIKDYFNKLKPDWRNEYAAPFDEYLNRCKLNETLLPFEITAIENMQLYIIGFKNEKQIH